MKRLTLFILMLAAFAVAARPALAQSKEIGGSWTLDETKSGTKDGPPVVILTIKGNDMTARLGAATSREMAFKLDGTETTMPQGQKTKAVWNAGKLEATVTSAAGVAETVTFSRDGEWLVLEAKPHDRGPTKLYFKKTPAKL